MRSIRLLAVAVLAVVLAVSSAQEAFAVVQLKYDNGTVGATVWVGSLYVGVRFSLPSGVSSAHLLTVYYQFDGADEDLTMHITGANHVTELTTPIATVSQFAYPAWNTYDVSGLNIVVSGDFFVILQYIIP